MKRTRALLVISFAPALALAQDPPAKELSEVVVESAPLERSVLDSAQSVTVLEGHDLHSRSQGSLGEALATEAGISSSYFGPGSSRPVIRGLGGDRIRVLENGTGANDVSNTSPDHLVTIDPLLSEKIEIVRGPATLLYGTSAVGGVVNVINGRILSELPATPISGRLEGRLGSVDDERTAAAVVNGRADNFTFHVDGISRNTDNIRIPGFARTGALRDEFLREEAAESEESGRGLFTKGGGDEEEDPDFVLARDRLPSSFTQTNSVGLGTSYVSDEHGYIGVSGDLFNSQYGLPKEDGAFIDADRRRFDVRGELKSPLQFIRSVETRFNISDYNHTEFEPGGVPGTVFLQDGWEGRVDVRHEKVGDLEGAFGVQLQRSSFSAVGEEAFLPPTDSHIASAFLFEDYRASDTLSFQGGARFDYSDYSADETNFPQSGLDGIVGRELPTWSFSLGSVYKFIPDYALALTATHTERAPSGTELFANGPHAATAAFEIGNPDLETERALGFEIALRKTEGVITGSLSTYYNRYNNFIGLFGTGEEEDELPVFQFASVDADFFGFEAELQAKLLSEGENTLSSDIQWDYVRAYARDVGGELPRITPMRLTGGLNYERSGLLKARLEVQHVFEMDRLAEFETETPGYTMVNASISHERKLGPTNAEFYLQGLNLADQLARNHVSFIKDIAPLPGLNVMGGLRLTF